jgi:murein DD-endopeptidase MepM/ murein hydrolase activator NlpD
MEKMLERQIEALMKADKQQSTSQSQSEPVAKVSSSIDSEIASSGDPATPHGRPVGGVLTQGSHAGHIALDFGIPVGTQVHSSMEGKVVYAGWNNEGYGNLVIVENGSYKTYYAHLSQIPVSIGQQVKAGETIGLSGNTGNSTGPHLHYEVRKDGAQINPTSFTLG